ncbi:DUF5691 domain-containing protein [Myceligenerans crystallogenes]|uniref:DUF5691 domain-containing protein n=1 Tax=Myceligenerans crystallogenes TaxID=316335 RepID=A0ABN2N8S2_9MICO
MSTWNQILSAALVGTDRRACVLDDGAGGAFADVIPSGALDPAELLHAAGAMALGARASTGSAAAGASAAGSASATTTAPVVPAGPDDRPLIPAEAMRRIDSILSGTKSDDNNREAVRWVRVAAESGLRPPPGRLPALLDLGARRRDARDAVLELGGARALWLATHDPDRWTWVEAAVTARDRALPATESLDRSQWDGGDVHAKVRYLTALRTHDPAASRDLLAEAWAGLRAMELALLAPVVHKTLEPADEEWLEAALGAGGRPGAGAASLLRALPGTAHERRMGERIREWVSRDDAGVLHVTLPEDLDDRLRRDGVERKPASAGQGERAWWFEQVVTAAPREAWSGLAADPAELVRGEIEPDLAAELGRGLTQAAVRAGDIELAARLVVEPRGGYGRFPDRLEALARALEPRDAVVLAVAVLRSGSDDMVRIDLLLDAVAKPWPEDLCEAVVTYLTPPHGAGKSWVNNVAFAARGALPLSYLDRIRDLADHDDSFRYVRDLADDMTTTAGIRAELNLPTQNLTTQSLTTQSLTTPKEHQ